MTRFTDPDIVRREARLSEVAALLALGMDLEAVS